MTEKKHMNPALKKQAEEINNCYIKGAKLSKMGFIIIAVAIIVPNIMALIFAIGKVKALEYPTMYAFALIFVWAILDFKFVFEKATAYKKKSDYIYKSSFITEMMKDFFEEAEFAGNRGLTKNQVQDGDMFKVDLLTTEDYLVGTYRGVHFEQSDVRAYKKNMATSSSKDTVFFKGRLIIIDIPYKEIQSVKVYSDKVGFDLRITEKNGEEVKLESLEFNKNFQVFAANPENAFYILTPQIQEVLLRLKKDYASYDYARIKQEPLRGFHVHFKGDKMYVFLEGNFRAFEQVSFPLDYEREYDKIQGDVSVIKDLIDSIIVDDQGPDR